MGTEPTPGRGRLRALRHRDFRLIAIGNMVSQLGFWGQYVAVGWEAKSLTDSDFLVAAAFAVQWLPALLLGPVAGVLADRFDRRRIVMLGNFAMVVPPLIIGLMIQTELMNIPWLLVLVFLCGVGQAFTLPAATAFVSALVPSGDLHSAVSLNAAMSNSTRIIGPTIAGALIAAWGVAWGFHVNAVSFLAVSWACMLVSVRVPPAAESTGSMVGELRLGASYTRQNKAVARLLILAGFTAFWNMHPALMPIFARDVLGGGVSTYGLLSAAPGLGFVAAAGITTMLDSERQQHIVMTACSFGLVVSAFTLALSREVPLSVAALGLFGLCHMSLTTIITTKLIAASDDAYRGRVMGVFSMAAIGAYPINSLIAGVLAAWVGPTNTVMLCGVALLASNLAFYGLGSMAIVNAGTGRAAATVADR